MEDLTKSQLVLLLILVSVVVSFTTAIVTATLVEQSTPSVGQTIQRVIERTVADSGSGEEKVRIVSEEDRIIEAVENVSSSVVSVVASKDLPIIEQCSVSPFGNDDFFNRIFPEFSIPQLCQRGVEHRDVSSGSGFFVSSDGMVVTNKHVVADLEADYTVVTSDGRRLAAEVLARDPLEDVAILDVDGNNFASLALGDSDSLRIGQRVIAIGNALGEFQNTVSVGVISGLSRNLVASGEQLRSVIQTDAAINPGNSGGPLLNLEGKVIGVNTAIAAGAENIGFALPVNLVKDDVGDVKERGRITYPFLGVRYRTITKDVQEELGLSVDHGAILESDANEPAVVSGSPADKAGLKESDVIIRFDGQELSLDDTLAELIQRSEIGKKVHITVVRNGKEIELEATLVEREF